MSPRQPGRQRTRAIEAGDTAGAMTEAVLQANVEGRLRFYGWRFLHVPDNKPVRSAAGGRVHRQRITPGFPDLIAVRELEEYAPELLVVELKAAAGRYGPGQEEWLGAFGAIGGAVDVARRYLEELEVDMRGAGGVAEDLPAIGVYTWRPSDLEAGTIDEVLAGPAGVNVPCS